MNKTKTQIGFHIPWLEYSWVLCSYDHGSEFAKVRLCSGLSHGLFLFLGDLLRTTIAS